MKYQLVDYYDNLFDADFGWIVNALGLTDEILSIDEDATDDDIVDYLIETDWLRSDAKGKVIVEWSDDSYGEIIDKDTQEPLYRLELVE